MTRIRTTHVGSLVRTPELVEVMRAREHGEPVDPAHHADVLTAAVADVVRRQSEIGIDVVSDGEYGKSDSWSRYVRERLGGFTTTEASAKATGRSNVPPGTDKHLFGEFYDEYEAGQGFVGGGGEWRATGPIHYTGAEAVGRDIANLRAALSGVDGHAEGFLRSSRRRPPSRAPPTTSTPRTGSCCSPSPTR